MNRCSRWSSCLLLGLAAACATAPRPIRVEWATESEVTTAGFNLYRAESPDGPFARINAGLIPASGDPLAGGDYGFDDASVRPGHTYYYLLEDVEVGGSTTRHGPIRAAALGPSVSQPILVAVALAGASIAAFAASRLGEDECSAASSQSPVVSSQRRETP